MLPPNDINYLKSLQDRRETATHKGETVGSARSVRLPPLLPCAKTPLGRNEFCFAAVKTPWKRAGTGTPRSSRSKRAEILATATEYFGRHGYEHTKWADIASAVGVGSTALYHYFESKLHCLYEIQADAVQANRDEFERIVAEHEDFNEALDGRPERRLRPDRLEVQRNRVLVAEQNLVGVQRTSPREEEARRLARLASATSSSLGRRLLTRGMEQGAIPQADPRLLARAILGLYTSVWHWYRPKGSMSLEEVRDFYVPRCLAIAGVHGRREDAQVSGAAQARPSRRSRAGGAVTRSSSNSTAGERPTRYRLIRPSASSLIAATKVATGDPSWRVSPNTTSTSPSSQFGEDVVRPGRRAALGHVAVELAHGHRRSRAPRRARRRTGSRSADRRRAWRAIARPRGPSRIS